MATAEQVNQFYTGTGKICEEIINALKSNVNFDFAASKVDLQWSFGEVITPLTIPEQVTLKVSSIHGQQSFLFSREAIEDSADVVERPDVRTLVCQAVAVLTGCA